MSGPDALLWEKAMDEKMTSLLTNGTWTLEEIPEGIRPIPVKWVYKVEGCNWKHREIQGAAGRQEL